MEGQNVGTRGKKKKKPTTKTTVLNTAQDDGDQEPQLHNDKEKQDIIGVSWEWGEGVGSRTDLFGTGAPQLQTNHSWAIH